ncbi:hypothetical protein TVAG_182880 [Trichomonas vaginalis G3]|uniref:Uncharacterized protein n=1 Tax=Trichomonas vaginalis (strain ATCC PRA-98 / G3) TaxID=412133 RepID=A2D926_TRIV3|nr:hypothetical protein TVAGG3_0529460 [Trichomonas vaginalis G3]EAY23052.1 hypothetical protein TVAG_182880 [Trichomonas vaginalis G3]KAI5519021.1 hypothetical protein TVAGG3_0529460 [Trichomonas vaginalis G3]|eukprot:XP_001584038.1 hypothetical protein [Trichomonas vaginalis G3]
MTSSEPNPAENHPQEEQVQSNQTQNEFVSYVKAFCSAISPSLEDLIQNHEDLSEITQKLQNLLESSKESPIQYEASKAIETALRHIISSITEAKENQSVAELSSMLAQHPSDVNIERLKLIELQRENKNLKNLNTQKVQEVKLAHQETDIANEKCVALSHEKEDLENKHMLEITNLKAKISSLEEQLAGQTDKDHQMTDSVASIQKRLRETEAQTESIRKQYDEAMNRLKMKNDYINKLQAKIQLSKSEYEQLKIEKSESEMSLSQQIKLQSMDSESKTKNIIAKLTNHIHEQDKQIAQIVEANHNAALIIERQNQLIDEYDAQASSFQMNINEAEGEIENLQQELEEAHSNKDEAQNILDTRTEELARLRNIVSRCLEAVLPKYHVTEAELPDVVRNLASTRIDPETAKNLQDLTALVDSLSRFTTELIRNNHADIKLLQDIQRPVLTDSTLRLDILNEIAEVKQLLKDICYSSAEEDSLCAYIAGFTDKYEMKSTTEAGSGAVLAAICTKLREFTKYEIDELKKVKLVLPFVCTDKELPTAVSQYLLELQPVFKQLLDVISKTLNFHGTTTDIFQCLCKYIEETSNMINDLDKYVRPLIGYSGKITGLPPVVSQALTELREDLNLHRNGVSKEIMNSKIETEKEKANWKRQVKELQDQVDNSGHVINDLQKQIAELQNKIKNSEIANNDQQTKSKELTRELDSQKETNKTLTAAKEQLIQEREQLEQTMKERQDKYETRLNNVLDHQRKLNEEEKARLEKRFKDEINALTNELTVSRGKLKKEQAKVRRITDLYNELQETRSTEKNQNEAEKSTLIMAVSDSDKQQKRLKNLQAKLEEEKQKNQELTQELRKYTTTTRSISLTSSSPVRQTSISPVKQTSPSKPVTRDLNNSVSLQMSPSKQTEMSQVTQLSQTAINRQKHEVEVFVGELGEMLNSFIGKEIRWNKQRVIKTVDALIQKVEQNDNESNQIKNSRSIQMSREWSEWADQVLQKKSPGYKSGITDNEMRIRLNDILALVSPRSISVVESLRAQKEILIQQQKQQENPQKENSQKEEVKVSEEVKEKVTDVIKEEIKDFIDGNEEEEVKERDIKDNEEKKPDEEKKSNQTTLSRIVKVLLFIAAASKKPQKLVVAKQQPGTNTTIISIL